MQYSIHDEGKHRWHLLHRRPHYGPGGRRVRPALIIALVVTLIAGAGGTYALRRITHHQHLEPIVFARPIYKVPTTIDSTGRNDVTSQLTKYFRSLPDGAEIVFPLAAHYRIEGTVQLVNRHNLTFAGNGATFFATTTGTRNRSQWDIVGGSGLQFRNLHVVGANPHGGTADDAYVEALEAQHGFALEGTSNFEMSIVSITDTYGDFVYITRDLATRTWSDGINIHNNTFRRNGRQGISIVAARNVTIQNNYITETRRAVVDLEGLSNSEGAINIHILNNRIGPGRLYILGGGRSMGTVDGITIQGNQLHNHLLNMIEAPPAGSTRSNFSIIDNTTDTSAYGDPPMRFNNTKNLTVTGNTQLSIRYPLSCNTCTGVVDHGNTFGRPPHQ